jgi:flavin-dependent dehydrogenase
LAVVILDREGFPRYQPGETLHPGVEAPLRDLGVYERVARTCFIRHDGISVSWAGAPHFVPYGADSAGPWRGFQVWRADFDAMLLERAHALGAEIWQPCRALKPILSRGRVTGVETSKGRIRASFVVDAAGSRHWLARRLELAVRHCSPPLIARFGYLEGVRAARHGIPTITADEEGWTWTAEVRPALYHWTRLNLDGVRTAASFLPSKFRGLSPRGRVRGANVGWRVVLCPAGPGYFIAGDAAAVVDPASSHGVLKALLSGLLAAHLIVEAFTVGRGERTVARVYGDWVAKQFAHDVAGLRSLYARLPRPPHWLHRLERIPSAGTPHL